jgi:hypothetical protein
MTPIGLLTLAGLGFGAYYVVSHRGPNGAAPRSSLPGSPGYTPGPEAYNPPGWAELLGTYQACVYGHCSAGDCAKLNAYLDTLDAETDDEQAWIDARRTEVARSCPAIAIPKLPDVFGIADRYQDVYNRCFTGQCTPDEVLFLTNALTGEALKYALDYPTVSTSIYNSVSSLRQETGVAGTPHVGNCGCAECAAKAAGAEDDEPCCEACAKGVGACACSSIRQQTEEEQPYTSGRA